MTARPGTETGAAGLEALVADPGHAVVACDFDGTLSPIVADPTQARAHPDVVPALRRLAPLVGTVAVITGRPAALAVEYGGFAGVPGLEHLVVLGHYGAERWDGGSGRVHTPDPDPGVAAARAELPALLAALDVPEGTWVEEKGFAVAVHTRRTPEPQALLDALRAPLGELAARHGLAVEPGRMVLELRPPGIDKGVALRGLLRERGARSVLYAGDDLGDVAAFDAVRLLRAEGLPGVLVASAPTTGEPPVAEIAERADIVVPGPAGVAALLRELADRCADRGHREHGAPAS